MAEEKDWQAEKAGLYKLEDKVKELTEAWEAEKAAHAATKEELHNLKVQFKLAKPTYVFKEGDSMCEPVVPGGKCTHCGWFHGKLDEHKKPIPHPILP